MSKLDSATSDMYFGSVMKYYLRLLVELYHISARDFWKYLYYLSFHPTRFWKAYYRYTAGMRFIHTLYQPELLRLVAQLHYDPAMVEILELLENVPQESGMPWDRHVK